MKKNLEKFITDWVADKTIVSEYGRYKTKNKILYYNYIVDKAFISFDENNVLLVDFTTQFKKSIIDILPVLQTNNIEYVLVFNSLTYHMSNKSLNKIQYEDMVNMIEYYSMNYLDFQNIQFSLIKELSKYIKVKDSYSVWKELYAEIKDLIDKKRNSIYKRDVNVGFLREIKDDDLLTEIYNLDRVMKIANLTNLW